MNKKKVLIISNKIMSYRLKVFDLLNEEYELTVAHIDSHFDGKHLKFKTIYTPGYYLGPFFIHKTRLKRLADNYDVVIGMSNSRWLSLMRLLFIKRKFKLILWGIGVSASYENKLDSKTTWDKVRFLFAKKADAVLFYSGYPIKKYTSNGIDAAKLFVAYNTVEVSDKFNLSVTENAKTDILFIGTLYPQKGIDILLKVYIKLNASVQLPRLNIVGTGSMKETIQDMVKINNLEEKVLLHGAIYDQNVLVNFFSKSLVCISPTQAGLSVLMSMGYGVPFLTSRDAITGGEIFNIKHEENGLLYDGTEEGLESALIWITQHRERMLQMGQNAKQHYDTSRTPKHLVNEIKKSVDYVLGE